MSCRGAIASINLNALKHNLTRLQNLIDGRAIIAMVKSNAYGHGLLRVAKTLNTVDAFGVACVDEALSLREEGITQPIFVMAGFYDVSELSYFSEHDLTAVIHHPEQLSMLEKQTLLQPLNIWLKIDTGMHRLGFSGEQLQSVYQRLQTYPAIKKPIGLMTHLADADNFEREFTTMQIEYFNRLTQTLTGPKSIVNSAGILSHPEALADWVRPGIMLYGVSPLSNRIGKEEGLQPVMTLSAKLIAIKHLKKGDKIGYGCTWSCLEDMPVGIVGIGYGDGYPRHAKSGTPTLLHGKECPLVGRVSMDMIAIDLRQCPAAKIGDRVVLWGDDLPIEKIAEYADTIPYELLCNVTQRVEFIEYENNNRK